MKAPSLEHIKAKQSRGKSIILSIGYSYLFLLNNPPPPKWVVQAYIPYICH